VLYPVNDPFGDSNWRNIIGSATAEALTRYACRMRILVATCITVFIVTLDTTIVNLAVRPLEIALRGTVSQLQWVVDAYTIAYSSLIVLAGAIGDWFGRTRMFVGGIVVFCAGCAWCAVASSVEWLIVARIVAGVGAAFALPASLAVLSDAYNDERARTHAVGYWVGMNGVAIAIGPPLGGALIAAFGWRSIFAVTLPFGALALAMLAGHSTNARLRQRPFPDALSTILAVAGLTAFTYAAIDRSIEFGLAGMVFLLAFVARDRAAHQPLIPATLLNAALFRRSFISAFCMTFGMYAFLFVAPAAAQRELHAGVFVTGLALVPSGLAFTALAPFATKLAATFGIPRTIGTGMLVIASGLALAPLAIALHTLSLLFAGSLLTGIGMGFATGPIMASGTSVGGAELSGMASALLNTARLSGATLGVAILGGLSLGAAMSVGAGVEVAGAVLAYGFVRR